MSNQPRKMVHLQYEGFPTYDGYYFRKADGLWFHSNEYNDDRCIHAFETLGDVFSLMPFELLKQTDWQHKLPPDWFDTLTAHIHARVNNKHLSVRKYFFSRRLQNSDAWEERKRHEYAYFIVAAEVWRQWQESGHVDDRWWEALAYAALRQGRAICRPLFFMSPWHEFTFFRQIHAAKTHEERARVIEILRPRPTGETIYVREYPYGWGREPLQMVAA